MEQTIQGELIGKYGRSRSMMVVFIALALVFAGVGGFLLWGVIPNIGKSINFSGDLSLLYGTGYGALGIGTAIFLIALIAMKPDTQFFLYENAIRTIGKHGDRVHYYKDIEDLFVFLYGGFGFRSSVNDPWIFAGGKTSGYNALTMNLRKKLVEHRSEKIYKELNAGQKSVFRRISDANALSKSFSATRNLNYPTSEVVLTKTDITIDGKTIGIDRLGSLKEDYWIERGEIFDVDGNVFAKFHPSAIYSFDVLCELIYQLQTNA